MEAEPPSIAEADDPHARSASSTADPQHAEDFFFLFCSFSYSIANQREFVVEILRETARFLAHWSHVL
jgi:hypothetical protein